MNRRGFTIVELIIVITIMAILLVLAVVNLRSTQVNARDDERKSDIDSLAMHLEVMYNTGKGVAEVGRYTSTGGYTTWTITNVQDNLRDIDPKSVMAPGFSDPVLTSFNAATNNDQTTSGVLPQPTISQYVYQPLQQDGTLCTTGSQQCQKFNLFYRLETDNTVYVKTSKNQ